jgi:hypothetical protein
MSATATKTCPDCAEEIKAAAHVCRFCGYRFDDPSASDALSPSAEASPQPATAPASESAPAAELPDASDRFSAYRERLAAAMGALRRETGQDIAATVDPKTKLREQLGRTYGHLRPDAEAELDMGDLALGTHPLVLAARCVDALMAELISSLQQWGFVGLPEHAVDQRLANTAVDDQHASTEGDMALAASRVAGVKAAEKPLAALLDAAERDPSLLPFAVLTNSRGEAQPTTKVFRYSRLVQAQLAKWLERADTFSAPAWVDGAELPVRMRARVDLAVDFACDELEYATFWVIALDEIISCKDLGQPIEVSEAELASDPEAWLSAYRARVTQAEADLGQHPSARGRHAEARARGHIGSFGQFFGLPGGMDGVLEALDPMLITGIVMSDLAKGYADFLREVGVPKLRPVPHNRKYERVLDKFGPGATLSNKDRRALAHRMEEVGGATAANTSALSECLSAQAWVVYNGEPERVDGMPPFPVVAAEGLTEAGEAMDTYGQLQYRLFSKWSERATEVASIRPAEQFAEGLCDLLELEVAALRVLASLP